MAGISQKITPEEVLPLLSRNVFTEGYEGPTRPTEFLILLRRYVVQARELADLAAGSGMVIRVSNCDDARPLLRILGLSNPAQTAAIRERRCRRRIPRGLFWLSIPDFPSPSWSKHCKAANPSSIRSPLLRCRCCSPKATGLKASPKNFKENSKDLLDTILNDPAVARLYWALSRLDPETSNLCSNRLGSRSCFPTPPSLIFTGGASASAAGRVKVPGGRDAEAAWKDLVGASPANPASFVPRLLAKDKGWLAAYFDVLSRVSRIQQAYFTEPASAAALLRWTARPGSFRPGHEGFLQTGTWAVASGHSASVGEQR